MARKKADTQTQSDPHKSEDKIHHQTKTMDDDKVDNLKSLNEMLLKETVERRQQVDSLVQSKGVLESELAQSVTDNASLQSEMNSLTEIAAMLEIDKRLVSVFLTAQQMDLEEIMKSKELVIKDLNSRLDELVAKFDEERLVSTRACEERDEIRAQLDARTQEMNELRLKVIEADNQFSKQIVELKSNCDILIKDNTASERRIESIMRDKDLIQKNLVESKALVDDLQTQLVEQKKTFEGELNKLLEKFAVLEKKYAASSKNELKLQMEINSLAEEKKVNAESLTNEKNSVTKHLEEIVKMKEQLSVLVKELAESRIESDNTKGKLRVAEANSNKMLTILKKTLLGCDENDDIDQENGGIEEHLTEIEAIKSVLKDKDNKLEEMNMQLELVKKSVAEARKEKSLWATVSSATTLLAAAASVVYVARSR